MKKILLVGLIPLLFITCYAPKQEKEKAENTNEKDSLEIVTLNPKDLEGNFVHISIDNETIVQSKNIKENGDGIYCYFFLKGDKATSPKLRIQYINGAYLHADTYVFNIDGSTHVYNANKSQSASGSARVVQNIKLRWFDKTINESYEEFLIKLSESDKASVKLVDKSKDETVATVMISAQEKLDIKRTLDYYKSLNGSKIAKKGMVNIRS